MLSHHMPLSWGGMHRQGRATSYLEGRRGAMHDGPMRGPARRARLTRLAPPSVAEVMRVARLLSDGDLPGAVAEMNRTGGLPAYAGAFIQMLAAIAPQLPPERLLDVSRLMDTLAAIRAEALTR